MRVLQICNKPPFPPVDGGCIAMHNTTLGLLQNGVEVDVLTITTNKHPVAEGDEMEDYKKSVHFESVFIDTDIKIKDAFFNLFSKDSYNVKRFLSKKFQKKIESVLNDKHYDAILLESLFTTPYIDCIRSKTSSPVVLRSHNIEHIVWQRRTENTENPIKKGYLNLLTNRLKDYENEAIQKVDAIITISPIDFQYTQSIIKHNKIVNLPVGYEFKASEKPICNKGNLFHLASMDWHPNIEGLKWFLDHVWFDIKSKVPNIKLDLAGRNMPNWVYEIEDEHIRVHGQVPSAKEFFEDNDIMIVPLLSGSGMRVKIIEGMALGKTIISTTVGVEGINVTNEKNILIADDPEKFMNYIFKCFCNQNFKESIGIEAKKLIEEEYNNKHLGSKLVDFLTTTAV
jgi:glycosyltransferase involved in cell wall biosynthesis